MIFRQSIVQVCSLIGFLTLAGVGMVCAQNQDPKPPKQMPAQADIVLTVTTDKKTYKDTDLINIKLTAKNTTKSPIALRFPNGMKFDIEIHKGKDGNGEKVWQWSRGQMFTMMLTSAVIAPDKPMIFQHEYNPANKGYDGKSLKLSAGTYTIVGYLATMGRTPRTMGSVTIQIQ